MPRPVLPRQNALLPAFLAPDAPSALAQALLAQRRARGRRVALVRWCVPLGTAQPWAFGEAVVQAPPDAAWHDGREAISWLAWGRACSVPHALRPAGRRRLRQVRGLAVPALPVARELWQRLPLWLGTAPFFASAPGRPPTDAGISWPENRPWAVPRLLCFRAVGRTTAVLTAWLPSSRAGCEALALAWHAEAAGWQAAGQVAEQAAGPAAGPAIRPAVSGAHAAGASEASVRPCEPRAHFERRVQATLAELARGPLQKVVLARAVACTPPRGCVPAAFASAQRLRALHPEAKVFYFSYGGGTAFVGATPEVLAQVEQNAFHSHALAGTVRRAATPHEDAVVGRQLLRSGKDLAEHAAVVRGLRRALRPLCTRLGPQAAPVARATQQLWHLHTPIAATLAKDRDILDVALALHPTPAVGGAPRTLALRQLRREEPWRGDFAAPLGWLSVGGGFLAVAIRSMLLTPRRAYAFAGAGIVRGSVPAAEWQETCAKLGTALGSLVWAPRSPRARRR